MTTYELPRPGNLDYVTIAVEGSNTMIELTVLNVFLGGYLALALIGLVIYNVKGVR